METEMTSVFADENGETSVAAAPGSAGAEVTPEKKVCWLVSCRSTLLQSGILSPIRGCVDKS